MNHPGLIFLLCACVATLSPGCSVDTETVQLEPIDASMQAATDESQLGDVHDAERVTEANVYDREDYWPNIVVVVEDYQPDGAESGIQAGYRGALVRVEPEGRVRIDFGRHGRHDVPIEYSDLVERANGIRVGTLHKTAPNFVLQIATRLVDPASDEAIPVKSEDFARAQVFLCVFADPMDEAFPALAEELATLGDLEGLGMLLIPDSETSGDLTAIKAQLRSSGWKVPFGYPRLSEHYALSLLGNVPAAPYALLITAEGRVMYRSELGHPDALREIRGLAEG